MDEIVLGKKPTAAGNQLCQERLYTLAQISRARDLPLKRCHQTWLNYATQGIRAGNGEVVVLETLLIGTRYQTSKEAVFRMVMKLERARAE